MTVAASLSSTFGWVSAAACPARRPERERRDVRRVDLVAVDREVAASSSSSVIRSGTNRPTSFRSTNVPTAENTITHSPASRLPLQQVEAARDREPGTTCNRRVGKKSPVSMGRRRDPRIVRIDHASVSSTRRNGRSSARYCTRRRRATSDRADQHRAISVHESRSGRDRDEADDHAVHAADQRRLPSGRVVPPEPDEERDPPSRGSCSGSRRLRRRRRCTGRRR